MKLTKTISVLCALSLSLAATSAMAAKGGKAVTISDNVTAAFSLNKKAKSDEVIKIAADNSEVIKIYPISLVVNGAEIVKSIGPDGPWSCGNKILDNPATPGNEAEFFSPKKNAAVWTKTDATPAKGEYQPIMTAVNGDETITFYGPKIVIE